MQCRAEMCSDEFLETAAKLDVKLEFGLQTIHKNEGRAVGRTNNMRRVNEVFDKLKQEELYHEVSIIFGLPNQTLASFIETVEWCLDKSIPVIKAFPLMLLRGTDIEQRKHEWNLIESNESMPTVISQTLFLTLSGLKCFRISEALKQTESNHPKSIEQLLEISKHVQIDYERFRP